MNIYRLPLSVVEQASWLHKRVCWARGFRWAAGASGPWL